MELIVERFRALACSSAVASVRSTLRYTQDGDPSGGEQGPVWVLVPAAEARSRCRAADLNIELDADGLVGRRPGRWECDTDTAMLGSYYGVALLDPVELPDGRDGGLGATIEELRVDGP